MALYAASLIKENSVQEALDLYVKYGAPALSQNYNIYRRIFSDIVCMNNTNTQEAYQLWANLRDMLHSLVRPSKGKSIH